jgi:nucleoid-associated protein YgaU
MLFRFRTLAVLFVIPLLTQCGPGSAPSANAVTGPFDSRGNYIEDWVDKPEKWYKPSTPSEKAKPKLQIAKNDPTPPPVIAVVQPKPKPVVVKPKPKPKPKVVKYTVKRGDNLSRIASRNGVSLSALRRANRISGDLIRPGQVLTIPK